MFYSFSSISLVIVALCFVLGVMTGSIAFVLCIRIIFLIERGYGNMKVLVGP